jgi:hypothetical protein
MKYYIWLLFILTINISLLAQTSRLRIEPMISLSYGVSYFNKNHLATTDESFITYNSIAGSYDKYGDKKAPAENNGTLELGIMLNYLLSNKTSLQFGITTSRVGANGSAFYRVGSGEWGQVYRIPILINTQILHIQKDIITVNGFAGFSIDLVRNDIGNGDNIYSINGTDTIKYSRSATNVNASGASLIGGFQLKLKLKNSNSLNFNIMGAYGLIPLVSNNYKYSYNNDYYYTELVSNGSFLRMGVGYEFQTLKKYFPVVSGVKIMKKKEYEYK